MGVCRYCGNDAGLLRSAHSTCEDKISSAIDGYVEDRVDLSALESTVRELHAAGGAGADVFIKSWDRHVSRALEDGVLTVDEEQRLVAAAKLFGLGQAELDRKGKYTRIVQAAIMREVLDGKVPERIHVQGLGINLQKSEKIVWVFQGVEYQTLKTHRSFQGVSHGVSIRIMKGVYYRPSMFRGAPVETTSVVSMGRGALAITNKHLYFLGAAKTLRIPYRRIISFHPYSDGLGVQRDGATAKPEVFKFSDGPFAYNLVMNLAQLQA